MKLIKDDEENPTKIVSMLPININERRAQKFMEKEMQELSKSLEGVFQDLNELDNILDDSFSKGCK